MTTVNYPYSKIISVITVTILSLLIMLSIPNLIRSSTNNDTINFELSLGFDFILGGLLIYFTIKRVIPAFKNCIALSVDLEKLNIYDKTIYYKDIENINFLGRPGQKVIYLKLKDDGKIKIETTWLKGNNIEICETISSCFDRSKQ